MIIKLTFFAVSLLNLIPPIHDEKEHVNLYIYFNIIKYLYYNYYIMIILFLLNIYTRS